MLAKFLAAAMTVGALTSIGGGAQSGPASISAFACAPSCQKCHQVEYESWAKTKHATAFDRLGSSDQGKECVGCHVTGAKTKIVENGKIVNKGVQCESCHGAAAAHVADPTVRMGLVAKTPASTCEECHSDKGPHF